jgi:hypothetical protein
MSWLNNRNELGTDDQSQSPVFKAMMARAKASAKAQPKETQASPKVENKQVRFDLKQPKPYTPTQSSPKGDPAWTAEKLDWTTYAPMALSGVVLAGTYFLTGGVKQSAPPQSRPVVIPGLGAV